MKKILIVAVLAISTIALGGCLARSTSPLGVNCIQGTPFQDLPVACIGGN